MVIGETQIVNQVKEAYAEAKAASCLNKVLHRLFQFSFALAKQVRETGLGSQGLSISYVAVKLAEQIFANLANHSVLLIGSGVMSELALLNLQSRGCRNFIIANRTLKNAEELAKKFTAKATELSEVPRLLNEVDLVIGSASLSAPILDKKTLQMRRRNEPLFLIDLGVPRNFSPSIKDLTNIYLYDLDSLNSFIQKNLAARNEAALEAEVYIDYAVSKFESWIEKQHLITSELKIRDEVGAICSKYCNLLLRDSRLNISEELREELSYKLKSSLGQYVIDLLNETKEL
jgi:glutamyl-tRNA reductase